MRARYCSTSARHVIVFARIADSIWAMVASSIRKGGPCCAAITANARRAAGNTLNAFDPPRIPAEDEDGERLRLARHPQILTSSNLQIPKILKSSHPQILKFSQRYISMLLRRVLVALVFQVSERGNQLAPRLAR